VILYRLFDLFAMVVAVGVTVLLLHRPEPEAPSPDIFVFILDDVADSDIDVIDTPAIDALSAQGTRFRLGYASPWCSPMRIGFNLSEWSAFGPGDVCLGISSPTAVNTSRPALARELAHLGYQTALFGKGHLGPSEATGAWEDVPGLLGYETWRAGLASNVGDGNCFAGNYDVWLGVDDGVTKVSRTYHTLALMAEFLTWEKATREGAPRFAVVAFQAAHPPFHEPPALLRPPPGGTGPPTTPSNRQLFEAMVESADSALGIMLAVIDPAAYVVLVGDNGTPRGAIRPDQVKTRVKKSVFEDGVRVPFVIRGPGVVAREDTGTLISTVDLAPTLLDLVGGGVPHAWDGQSAAPVLTSTSDRLERRWVYFQGSRTRWGVRGERWKLRHDKGQETLYDLLTDPDELTPLPAVGPEANVLREFVHRAQT
jgi:arylsulfatase A-like enzyme